MIGIYIIKNRINNKVYVGQSWNLEKRLQEHRVDKRNHQHLLRAFNKYGMDNFDFTIIKEIKENC